MNPQPNWWERLLPTAGGMAGSVLGSMVPVPGLDIAAASAGGAAGGALGKLAENKLTGQAGSAGVGTSAVENAAGGAVGSGIGEGLSALMGAGSDMAGNVGVSSLMKQSGDRLARPDAQYLWDNGINSLKDIQGVIAPITGDAGNTEGAALSRRLADALSNSKQPVDVSNVSGGWQQYLQKYPGIQDSTVKNISGTIDKVFSQMASDSGFDVNQIPTKGAGPSLRAMEPGALSSMDPGAVFTQIKNLEDLAYGTTPRTIDQQAGADIYKNVAKDLEGAAYGSGGAVPLTDADKAGIIEDISAVKDNNPKLYQTLTDQINNAGTWKDIRTIQSPLTRASLAQQGVEDAVAGKAGTTVSDVTNKTGLAKSILSSGPVNRGETTLMSRLSGALGDKGTQTAMKVLPQIGAIGLANMSNYIPSPNATGNAISNPAMGPLSANANMLPGANMTPTNPINTDLSTMMGMMTTDPYLTSALAGPIGSLSPIAQKYGLAQNALGNLSQAFNMAGGAQGGGQGMLTQLSSLFPWTAAHAYNQQLQAAMAALGGASGISPGALTGMAPNFMQSPLVAQQRLAGLGQLLQ